MRDVVFKLEGLVNRQDVQFLRTGGDQRVMLGSWINVSLQEPEISVEQCYEIIDSAKLRQFIQTEVDSFVEIRQATWYPISSLI